MSRHTLRRSRVKRARVRTPVSNRRLSPQLAQPIEVGSEPDIRSFRMVFESVTCDECGTTVHVHRTCACGAWKPRQDEHVIKRRDALTGLYEQLSRPVEATESIDLDDAVVELSPWIADFFEALNIVGEPSGDAARARTQIETLVALRRRVAAVPRYRPSLALWDPLSVSLGHLAQMAATYLEAATSESPESAQPFESMAQSHLDDAAAAVRTLNDRLARWGGNRSIRLPDSLVGEASEAYQATNAHNLLDLDSRGQVLYARISGRIDPPPGIGLGLLLDIGHAGEALDEERLYMVAGGVYRRLSDRRERLLTLLADDGWRKDLLNARRVFYEARLSTETVLSGLSGERRMEVRAVLDLGARVTERVSATLIGLVVAAGSSRRVKRTADYTTIHQAARQAGFDDLLVGFDERVRKASAHEDYLVEEGHVLLLPGRGPAVRMADDALIDIVLAGLESAAAIFAGLDCVLAELEHPSAADRLGDLTVQDRVKIMMAVCGIHPTEVAVGAHHLAIAGTAMASVSLRPLSIFASIVSYLPPELSAARLRLKRTTGSITAEVELEPLRRFLTAEGIQKDIAFLEFLAGATIDNRPVFPRAHTRFMAATLAHRHLETPLAAARNDLGELAAFARRTRDIGLAESLDAFIAMRAANEGGPPAGPLVRRRLARLVTYGTTPPGAWNDGSLARDPPTGALPE